MSESTSISWTDATFNPWWGCTSVSPGCDHCYAETFDKRVGGDHWGKGKPRRVFGQKHWDEPLQWNDRARKSGIRTKVFCASMADVMDDEAPEGQRERLWELIDRTPYLVWQLLTKRPQRYARYLPQGFAHNNVWLGTTAENQEFYNIRWAALRQVAADYDLTSFISYEPALGGISMDEFVMNLSDEGDRDDLSRIVPDYPSWLIFGGETGGKRRPMEQRWAEWIKDECQDSGTYFFMKQMSASTPARAADLIPVHLLVREFPPIGNEK